MLIAGLINRTLGGAFIAPWEVDELTPEIIDPIIAMATELPSIRKGTNEIEMIKASIRRSYQRIH